MAKTFMVLGNGRKLSTDRVTETVGSNQHDVDRQHMIAVQPEDASQIGFASSQLVDAELVSSGSAQMAIDGTTPATFEYVVPTGKGMIVDEVVVYVYDAGATVTPAKFGDLAALGNGITLAVLDDSDVEQCDLVVDQVKKFGDLLRVARLEMPFVDAAQFTIDCARGGAPMYLPAGYSITAVVSDNLTGVDDLRITVRGRLIG